jgi:acetate kinase
VKVLVLNSGSSSVKFQLIETSPALAEANQDRLLAKGQVEKIGSEDAVVSYQPSGEAAQKSTRPIADHQGAIQAAFECLKTAGHDIDTIGHRIVHGGEHFTKSVLIDDEVLSHIEACYELAPLHNPAHVKGYKAARVLLPQAPQVAVFDTAFHQSLPPKAYLYGIPYDLYERHRIRRYGFHGSSHRYVSWRYAQIQGVPLERLKLITCHLGNGCSVCAIDGGRSVETSMGFTPLEGLVMGTRPGDLDSGVLVYLLNSGELSIPDIEDFLNRRSGLLGLTEISNDMRDIKARADSGDQRAATALDVYCHRVKKYLGAYHAVLNGADAIVFTGGVGEHQGGLRARICESLGSLGIEIDSARNDGANGVEKEISADGSRVKIWVIPTNEELVIARDTMRCIINGK